jgi:ribose transport system substrate-binding protein
MTKRGIGRVLVAGIVVALVCTAGAAGSSTEGMSAAAPAGGSAPKFGRGLKLGTVISTAPAVTVTGPWLVWNPDTCAYQPAANAPKSYVPRLRRVAGSPQIGYMYYGDFDAFGVANSKDIKAQAAKAGFKLNSYNLKFPSQTEPLSVARSSVLKKDLAVMEANLDDKLIPRFLDIIQKKGCIPNIQMYLEIKGLPGFGAKWPDSGTTQGKWFAQQAKARGWKPSDTALVECTDPDNGPSVNVMFDTAPKALIASGFAIPKSNIFKVVCKYQTKPSAETTITDWFTAHPKSQFPHVMLNSIDDERMQGITNAVRRSRRQADVLTIATGADELGQKQIRAGIENASIAYFPEKYGQWLIPLIEDVLAGNPVPSFTGSGLVIIDKSNIDKYYPG